MCAHVLPYLLQMGDKYSQSSSLAHSLTTWAKESAAQVLTNLTVCKELLPGNTHKKHLNT